MTAWVLELLVRQCGGWYSVQEVVEVRSILKSMNSQAADSFHFDAMATGRVRDDEVRGRG